MVDGHASASPSLSRRSLLAGVAAGGSGALSGCSTRVRSLLGREGNGHVTLTIRTIPADGDPYALLLARRLAEWFTAAGLGARVVPMDREALLRRVLVNHDYDVFIGRFPYRSVEPDALRGLLHSRFAAEPGWQNPFGFADLDVDETLTAQLRASGGERRDLVADLQRTLAVRNPLAVLAFPDTIRAVRTDRFTGFAALDLASPLGVLGLAPADADATTLRVTTTDARPMSNLNPLQAALRRRGRIVDLVYDSLGRRHRGAVVPWLASAWEWVSSDPPVLSATLRPDLTWHDGTPLTPADVAFTFDFLQDTAMGEREQVAPPMRYRGRAATVQSVTAASGRTLRIRFDDVNRAAARRALTVPVLPRHVWRERTGRPSVGGVDLDDRGTEALVTRNLPPVGSGPLAFVDATSKGRLVLERFDDHFLGRSGAAVPPAVAGAPGYERLVVRYAGGDQAAVELVESGDADCTLSALGPDAVPRIGRSETLSLQVDPSKAFYFAGFNCRRAPIANPRFRHLLARLVDRTTLVAETFSEFATPAATPLAGTDWVPEALAWDGSAPETPFLGTDGTVDVAQARAAFRDAGYQYDEDGRLVTP